MGQTVRNHSQLNHRVLDLSVEADLLEFVGLMDPAFDLGANGWVDGQELRDTFTGTILRVQETPGVGLFWTGGNCTVRTAEAGAGAPKPFRYVVLSATNVVDPGTAGDVYHGICLSNGDTLADRCYVLEIGRMLVVQGATPPTSLGAPSMSDTDGKTKIAVSGEFYGGFWDRTAVTVGGNAYQLVTISGTIGVFP